MSSGLTAARATTLIATISTPKVRMTAKGGAQHRSTAVLKEVQGDHAIVQPHGHRRTERVPLSSLTEWKSANESAHKKKTTPKPRQPRLPYQSVRHNADQSTKYVVFSRKQKGMFGGTKKRWTTSPQFCVEYATESGAKRSATKLKKNNESDDAEVMTLVAGRQLAIDLSKQAPTEEVPQKESGPRLPFEDFGADLLDPTIASIMTLDFEHMKSLDATKFVAAMDKRTKAIAELLELQQMMADSIAAVRAADAEVREAARAVLVTEDIDIAEASASAGQTVTIKSVVRNILLEEPNSLFKKHLITKAVDTGISKAKSPRTSVGITINKMIEDGYIKINSNNTLCWVDDGA